MTSRDPESSRAWTQYA